MTRLFSSGGITLTDIMRTHSIPFGGHWQQRTSQLRYYYLRSNSTRHIGTDVQRNTVRTETPWIYTHSTSVRIRPPTSRRVVDTTPPQRALAA